jgi:hypothetical protein
MPQGGGKVTGGGDKVPGGGGKANAARRHAAPRSVPPGSGEPSEHPLIRAGLCVYVRLRNP